MPERRRPRSARSSSGMDMAIGVLLKGLSLRVRFPERLVLGDGPDGRALLDESGRTGRGCRRLPFEGAPDGRVRDALGVEEAAAHGLDVRALVRARQVRQAVQRPLAGPTKVG